MTQGELCSRMTSREFTEHVAFARYFAALPDAWRQTGLLVAATLGPHSSRNHRPKPDDFNPIDKPPQHESQDIDAIMELRKAFGITDDG